MKAWWVHIKEEDWGALLHGETRQKAIYLFMQSFSEADDWRDIRAIRAKDYDDKPVCSQTMWDAYKNGGIYYSTGYDEDGYPILCEHFYNECNCEICKNA